ncbi:MAG: UvrD-helicase domain-containing protein [Vicinamibacteria bacterium]
MTTTWRLIVGPPGTGKTTELLRVLRSEIDRGVRPERIAFLSFTRAARLEALTRVGTELGLHEDDMPWCRTVHSAAYRLLKIAPASIMMDERWNEFAKKYGYDFSDVEQDEIGAPLEAPARTPDDGLRWVYSWGRSRRLGLEATAVKAPMRVDRLKLFQFAYRFDEFRRTHDLLDFTDMVERVVERQLAPSIDVALIDEAQDLSPLEIAAVRIWTEACERVYVAGDPDQAVYNFKGADPAWMLSLAKTSATTLLRQSHRVPVLAHAISSRIIAWNRARIASAYLPAPRDGTVGTGMAMGEALDAIGDVGAFVLARNRAFLRHASWHLFDTGRPYLVEGGGAGPNPLGNTETVRAVRTAHAIHKGMTRIDSRDVAALLTAVPVRGSSLVDYGARARVLEMRGFLDVPAVATTVGFEPLLRALTLHPTRPLLRLDERFRTYFQTLLDKHGEIPGAKIRLMTIHASKGREHEHVVLLPDHTTSVDEDYRRGDWESENRIRYVAVTRTRERLTITRPTGRKYYEHPVDRRTA